MPTQRNESFRVFFLIAVTILSIAYGYTGWRIIGPLGLGKAPTVLLWLVVASMLVMPFASISLRFTGHDPFWGPALAWASYLGMGLMSVLFTFVAVRDFAIIALKIVLFVVGVARGTAIASVSTAIPAQLSILDITRQSNLILLSITGIFMLWGMVGALKTPSVKDVTIPLDNAPPAVAALRIVQITDLHIGQTIGRRFMRRVVDRVNALEPDIVVLTGDLADGTVESLRDDAAPLADIRARHGVFFVTGNHEYYSGVLPWIAEAERLGMTVLVNEHRLIDMDGLRLLVAGVTDTHGGEFLPVHATSPEQAMNGAPPHDVSILLAHQPRSVFEAGRAGFDVQISGHTHGGQYYPWNWFVRLQQPYAYGLHRHGGTWLYISRGTCFWGPPLRVGQPSEITLLRFSPESDRR